MYNSLLIVSAGGSSQGAGLWCTPFGCVDLAAVAVALLAGTSALAVLVSGTLLYLSGARTAVERERQRTAVERDALARFTRRVSRLDATGPASVRAAGVPAGGRPDGGTAADRSGNTVDGSGNAVYRPGSTVDGRPAETPAQTGTGDDALEHVREAYRETVMAVDHYEEEYGETLAEDLAAEFGEAVATAVVGGDRLTPALKAALLRGSETARGEREAFVRALDREDDALDAAAEAFGDLLAELERRDARPLAAKPLAELAADWERLGDLRAECAEVLADRQDRIHDGYPTLPQEDGVGFHRYLYRSLSVTHPVLAEGAAIASRLRTARRRVTGAALHRA